MAEKFNIIFYIFENTAYKKKNLMVNELTYFDHAKIQ